MCIIKKRRCKMSKNKHKALLRKNWPNILRGAIYIAGYRLIDLTKEMNLSGNSISVGLAQKSMSPKRIKAICDV
jgi:hypothetical protein